MIIVKNGNKGMHITEEKYPLMTIEWKKIDEELYNLILDKNADYSPYAILGTGMVGIVTSIWHKIARIMWLTGFDIATGNLEINKTPLVKETLIETLKDLRNYVQIGIIYLEEKWGK
jgi:hypothetical protein